MKHGNKLLKKCTKHQAESQQNGQPGPDATAGDTKQQADDVQDVDFEEVK